jgi:serine/threonine-protein kinase RsbW
MKQSFDFVEMKIPAKPEYVGVIRLTLSGIASRMSFPYDDIEDLKIAVSEACTNAVHHAYSDVEEGEVTIGFGLHDDRLEIMVADSGRSFDFDEIREEMGPIKRDHPVDDMTEGGLGLFLIDTLMDRVQVSNNAGVIVMMTKFLKRDGVEFSENTISTSQTN